MAEKYSVHSPYHFAGNNPVNNLEVNGAEYLNDGTWRNDRGPTTFGGYSGNNGHYGGGSGGGGHYSYYGANGYMGTSINGQYFEVPGVSYAMTEAWRNAGSEGSLLLFEKFIHNGGTVEEWDAKHVTPVVTVDGPITGVSAEDGALMGIGGGDWSWELPLVVPVDKFVGDSDDRNCGQSAFLQCQRVGVTPSSDRNDNFFIYFTGGWKAGTLGFEKGYTGPNKKNVIEAGERYLINQLYEGKPVMVCVDYQEGYFNRCGGEHWVNIVAYGIDKKGDFYFSFFDNYTSVKSRGTDPLLRFYWNNEQKAFQSRPEAELFNIRDLAIYKHIYTITSIRRNK